MSNREYDVVIVGGLGHVGLPLGLVFANKGLNVCLYDINEKVAAQVKAGKMPFIEYDADPILEKVLAEGKLHVDLDPKCLSKAEFLVLTLGTPIDEYLNPKTRKFLEDFEVLLPHLDSEQTLIVRSTVYPQTCEQLDLMLKEKGKPMKIAYCPERIVQGYSVKELDLLPQVIAGVNPEAIAAATRLFEKISPKIIPVSMGEAELVKLFSNAWRYIQFAVANQFYMICTKFGLDYDRVRAAMRDGYERNASLPSAGFSAGPCLLKDTMQLSSYDGNTFQLGQAAMVVNEGLPNFLVEQIKKTTALQGKTVGVLGMAFKADIDDIRDSLSFKLAKILRFNGSKVMTSDEYAEHETFCTKEDLIEKSDIIIVAVPHSQYKGLTIPKDKLVVDLWKVVEQEK